MKDETYMTRNDWAELVKKYNKIGKPMLIGLAGPKGVGKTTYAKTVLKGKVFSLATPIKAMLSTIVPKRFLYDYKETPIPGWPEHLTGRFLLQNVGTECFRKMWPDIWVNYLMEEISHEKGLSIVDDVRFENEAEFIRAKGGEIWRLHRKGVSSKDSHISEAGLPNELVNREIHLDGQA